jgi:flagellar basal-body rod protein FlgG
MVRGLYTAYTGMAAQQKRMDIISNNLANVNTTGFKKDGVVFETFKEAYMYKVNDPEETGTEKIGTTNFGVRIGENYTNFEQGSFEQTGDQYNLALEGDGMFVVGRYDDSGVITEKYTRDGCFGLNSEGKLVTRDGYFVIGENGPIVIDEDDVYINENGNIESSGELIDKIKIVDFENTDTLKKTGNNLFESTDSTIEKEFSGKVLQGFVETSNVETVNEMVNMIDVLRTYESNEKVLSTIDDTLSKAVNDVGEI